MTKHVHQHSSLPPNTMELPSHHCQHLPQQHSEEKAQNVLKRNFSREYTFNSNGLSNQIVTKHVHRHSLPPSTMAPQLAAACHNHSYKEAKVVQKFLRFTPSSMRIYAWITSSAALKSVSVFGSEDQFKLVIQQIKTGHLKKRQIPNQFFCLMKCLISNQIFSGILPLHIFDGNR